LRCELYYVNSDKWQKKEICEVSIVVYERMQRALLKPDSGTYNFVEVSGHNAKDGVEDDLTKEGWLVLLPPLHVLESLT
jgi:hypothetical protein